ncbi:hypothetical protein ACA910_007569 [Epithemia clementina (nom. ined.)]
MSKKAALASVHIIESFFYKPNTEEVLEPLPAIANQFKDIEQKVKQHDEDEQYIMMLLETASIGNNTAISSISGAAASSQQHSQLDAAVHAFEKAAKVAHENACHYITQEAARVNKQMSEQLKVEQDAEKEHDENQPKKSKRRLSSYSCSSSSSLCPKKPTSAAFVVQEPEKNAMRDEALLQQAIRSKRMIDLLFKLQRVQMRLLDEMMACVDDADFLLDAPIHEVEAASDCFL